MKIIILCVTAIFCSLCFSPKMAFALFYESSQGSVMSTQCPTGGKEAEELYKLGRQYRDGHGVPSDKKKAEELFEQALAMGNAKPPSRSGRCICGIFHRFTRMPSAKST